MKPFAVLLIATLVALCGCGGDGGGHDSAGLDLAGTSWVAETGSGTAVAPTMKFSAKTVSGSGGCNSFGGDYEVDGAKLGFGALVSTQMACPGQAEAIERGFFSALEATTRGRISDEELTLEDSGGKVVLRLRPSSAEGSWRVTSFLQGDAVTGPLPGTELTADLSADGSLSGSAGCNRFHGHASVEGDSISFGAIGATRKHCETPVGVMEQEREFLAVLPRTRAYRLDPHGLTLLTAAGTIVATFEPMG